MQPKVRKWSDLGRGVWLTSDHNSVGWEKNLHIISWFGSFGQQILYFGAAKGSYFFNVFHLNKPGVYSFEAHVVYQLEWGE